MQPYASCDGCGVFPIVGSRYHCLQCPDFDLCKQCKMLPFIVTKKGVHSADHKMIKIAGSPVRNPDQIGSPYLYSPRPIYANLGAQLGFY